MKMRAPIAYLARRTAQPVNTVPRLSPEDYAGMIFPTGRGGTVTVEDDGTGTVRDQDGRYRTTLPAHTVELVARRGDGTSPVAQLTK